MKSNWSRRQFLIRSGHLGLGLMSLHLPLVRAQSQAIPSAETEPHFFILLRAPGGAHTSLGLDPQVPSELRKSGIDDTDFYFVYRDEDLIQSPQGLIFGPAASPLRSHFSDIAVVNGIMQLAGLPIHGANLDYASTGDPSGDSPAFPFQLGKHLDAGTMGVAYNIGVSTSDLKMKNYPIADLLSRDANSARGLLDQEQKMSPEQEALEVLKAVHKGGTSQGHMNEAQKTFIAAQAKIEDYFAAFNEISEGGVRVERYFDPFFETYRTRRVSGGRLSSELSSVLAAFQSGLSRFAAVDLDTGSLDTHFDHSRDHIPNLRDAFEQVANVITVLKETPYKAAGESEASKSLFDCTTIMFCSDFGRSAWREREDGTAHNPLTNSVLLAGKGIQGGQKIGAAHVWSRKVLNASESKLQGLPFDYREGRLLTPEEQLKTMTDNVTYGECREGGSCVQHIFPENIYRTIGEAFGFKKGLPAHEGVFKIPGLLKT